MEVVKAENLSKKFVLGSRQPYSLRDMLAGLIKPSEHEGRELWALRDVSFSVNDGETLGLIGDNGAGKSTLLKILSRITKPTGGEATILGRVGSLLEVGTGFHAELSGRENIYLNGAILGMRRVEIADKFDEIAAFSEIEDFLDTPVKHYSTGMYMRLAFSIAAHLDPEILIVDEVLAVGDVEFQRKCLRKMRSVGESGRTVIFVSHDMRSITRLCKRTIWIKDGKIRLDGESSQVVGDYLHERSQTGSEMEWAEAASAPGNEIVQLRSVRVCNEDLETVSSSDIRKPVFIQLRYDVLHSGKVFVPSVQFTNEQGTILFVSYDWTEPWRTTPRPSGTYTSTVAVPGNFLAEGVVFVTVGAATHRPYQSHFEEREIVTFTVIDTNEGGTARGDLAGFFPGAVRPSLEWKTEDYSEHSSGK